MYFFSAGVSSVSTVHCFQCPHRCPRSKCVGLLDQPVGSTCNVGQIQLTPECEINGNECYSSWIWFVLFIYLIVSISDNDKFVTCFRTFYLFCMHLQENFGCICIHTFFASMVKCRFDYIAIRAKIFPFCLPVQIWTISTSMWVAVGHSKYRNFRN